MNTQDDRHSSNVTQITQQIIDLIFAGHYDQATALIDVAGRALATTEVHRLTALNAVLQNQMGNIDECLELMRQAVERNPTWLPHLYRLSAFLMDAGRWLEADKALHELVLLSERMGDAYFVDEGRLRRVLCLRKLGRDDEAGRERARIAPGTSVYLDDRIYRLDDV